MNAANETENDSDGAFAPGAVRYIKLGPGGAWAGDALANGQIPFGYRAVDHEACLAKDWQRVRDDLQAMGRSGAAKGQGLREIRDFYELPADTLWVTAADGHLWWCFADAAVEQVLTDVFDSPSRFRRTIDGWRSSSLTGQPLAISELSSALIRTTSFRMTLCAVEHEAYLLRRIRGLDDPVHSQARALQGDMRALAVQMLQRLDFRDFEVLVDLLFTRNGWQRTGVLGKEQRDVDLLVEHPLTGERGWVQVKSKASQKALDDYLARFERDGTFERFFFVCHSGEGALLLPSEPHLHLWTGAILAEAVLQNGLFDWLVKRTQ